jgi:hypothetical protein
VARLTKSVPPSQSIQHERAHESVRSTPFEIIAAAATTAAAAVYAATRISNAAFHAGAA